MQPPSCSQNFDELFARTRGDSAESWGALFERYRGYLGFLAWRQLDPQLRGKVGASDVVQDTFLRAHQHRTTFRGATEAQLIAWLQAILASRLAEQLGRYSTESRNINREVNWEQALSESAQSLAKNLVSPEASPSSNIESLEMQINVGNALSQLPEHYRVAVVSCYLDGLSLRQIASANNWTDDQVQKYVQRGLAALMKLLNPDL